MKTDKRSSKGCPYCGNTVVYDQSKGKDAKCPVCHENINTRESMAELAEFTCPSRSCKLSADKSSAKYTCRKRQINRYTKNAVPEPIF